MFKILLRREAKARRSDTPSVLISPAPKNILLGINGVVDANVKLIGKDRIGNVECVVEGCKIVHASLDRQRIKLENRGGNRTDTIRRDRVIQERRSVDIVDCCDPVEIAIPHILAGYRLQEGRLAPEPHAFVVAKEERVILKDGSGKG